MTVGQEGAEEVEAVTLGARAEEEETQGEEEEVRPGGLEGGGEDLKEVAEEVVAVTGVMRGGVKMEITGVTQEIEEEGVMEEAFPELVGEVVRRGAAVVAEEGMNIFSHLLNDVVEEAQGVGVMDRTGVESLSQQAQDKEDPANPFHLIEMNGSLQHHQQQPLRLLLCLHVVMERRSRDSHQAHPLDNLNP